MPVSGLLTGPGHSQNFPDENFAQLTLKNPGL